jgi:hypothetical protein
VNVTTRRIERLTIKLEPGDKYYHVPSPYSRRFYVVPASVVAEYDSGRFRSDGIRDAILTARVAGQRYRHMADGTVKAVGPGRGPASEPTIWEFPYRSSMPQDLVELLYDAYLRR